jgi:hypothetical protein
VTSSRPINGTGFPLSRVFPFCFFGGRPPWSHSGLLLRPPPQTLVPASPAVHTESLPPHLTRTSVRDASRLVKRFGLFRSFTPACTKQATALPSRPINGGGSSRPASDKTAHQTALPYELLLNPIRSSLFSKVQLMRYNRQQQNFAIVYESATHDGECHTTRYQ